MNFISEIRKREVETRDVSPRGWHIYGWKTGNAKIHHRKYQGKFNISESVKVNKFLGVYYGWGHDVKGTYTKMTMEKGVKKLVEGYEKYTGSDLRVQKTPGDPGTNLSKSELEDPDNINTYRSFVGQLMWYTTKVGPDLENTAMELAVHMSHPGPEHWKGLGRLIGYLKGK